MTRQIVLDTETTGLAPSEGHRVIEIAAVELYNRRFTGKHFHYYLNPEREIDAEALSVHGLNNAFLADKPKFAEVLPLLVEYLTGTELIIHNAAFDVAFLEHELRLAQAEMQKLAKICRITDTLVMARKLHPGQKNSLDALCKRYKVDNTQRNLHGALLDAQLLAKVYLAMTGGQSSLLGEEAMHVEVAPAAMVADVFQGENSPGNYVIHSASPTELEAHEAFLALIKKKSQDNKSLS